MSPIKVFYLALVTIGAISHFLLPEDIKWYFFAFYVLLFLAFPIYSVIESSLSIRNNQVMRRNTHIGDVESARKMVADLIRCDINEIKISKSDDEWFLVERQRENTTYFLQKIKIIKG